MNTIIYKETALLAYIAVKSINTWRWN